MENEYITFNYYCLNSTGCSNRKLVQVQKTREEEAEEENCPECNKPMKLVGEHAGGGYLTFGSLTPDQKRAVLAKRSREHFNREIKERKHVMDKTAFGVSDYDKKKD